MLVVRALKISQLTDGGLPPTYDSMHWIWAFDNHVSEVYERTL